MAPFPIHLAPAGQGPGAYIYSYSICNLSYLDLYQHSRLATKKHVLHLSTPKKTQLTFFFPQQNTINRRRIRPSPLRHPGPSESESDRSIGPVRKETLGPLGVLDLGPGTWNASRLRDLSFHSRSGRESERVVSRHKVVVDRGGGSVGWLVKRGWWWWWWCFVGNSQQILSFLPQRRVSKQTGKKGFQQNDSSKTRSWYLSCDQNAKNVAGNITFHGTKRYL